MCSSSNVSKNAAVAIKLIDDAVARNAKVLFLPEAADYISRDATHSVQLAESTKLLFVEPLQEHIRKLHSQSLGIAVAVGVHEPGTGEDHGKKVANNQLWIAETGEIEHRYQKIHLFDVDIPNGPILKESNSVIPGLHIVPPFPLNQNDDSLEWRVGLAICYDIRFPEFTHELRKAGANIITFPSAFTTTTGEAHWLTLGKARAIDSQCYVIMAAQCGEHNVYADVDGAKEGEKKKLRVSYGQSVVIGPWGEIVAIGNTYKERPDNVEDYYELVEAEIDLDRVDSIRKNLPVLTHRRTDVFSV